MASKGRERAGGVGRCRRFQRDRDRIVHSKAFRRLKHKTQVFLAPEGDHYRVRLTHTLEVTQIARTAARALRLNEDLTEAIALGHDLGHTPPDTRRAGAHAVPRRAVPAQRAVPAHRGPPENDGTGLNLTWEVRDGIVNHTWSMPAAVDTRGQGRPARGSDRVREPRRRRRGAGGAVLDGDTARRATGVLGVPRERIDTLVTDLVAA